MSLTRGVQRGLRVSGALLLGLTLALAGCDDGGDGDEGAGGSGGAGGGAGGSGGEGAAGGMGGAGGAGGEGGAEAGFRHIGAANELPDDHPAALGQDHYLHNTWGEELTTTRPPVDFLLALMENEPEVFGDQLSAFGFIPDPNDDLPVGLKRGSQDPARYNKTCALCHVARLPDGRLWIGMPNTRLELGRFEVEVHQRWVNAGHEPYFTEDQIQKRLALGPGRIDAAPGGFPDAIAIDFPPYFDQAVRQHMGSMGVERELKTSVYLSLFTGFNLGYPNDEAAETPWPETGPDEMVAYHATFEAPDAPPPADPDAALRGEEVYARAACGACHHIGQPDLDGIIPLDDTPLTEESAPLDRMPDADEAWPDGAIATDPLVLTLQNMSGESGGVAVADVIRFIGRNRLKIRPTNGYRVTQLKALWATAPYLHNGSVATLADLLTPPAERPTMGMRAGGFVFDTTVVGNSARGHAFGTDLTDGEKADLIVYLMTL